MTNDQRQMTNDKSQKIALILAAGASTRMGTCKASLGWAGGMTLLTYQVHQWWLSGFIPVVVLGLHNANLQYGLPSSAQTVVNTNATEGKTSSILVGLQTIAPTWEVLAIAAVDQPRPAWIYQMLLRSHVNQKKLITAPAYMGKLGHPLLFSREMLAHLQAIREESLGLRQVVKNFASSIHSVEVDDAIVLTDLNTPDIYQKTLEQTLQSFPE